MTVSWELFVHIYEVHEMFCVWGTMVENSTNSQEGFFSSSQIRNFDIVNFFK